MNLQINTNPLTTLENRLKQGFTLPGTWYTRPLSFQIERERIFNRSWNYAGRIDQVSKPGDFFSCQVGGVPIIVVRDELNQLKAFVNVCKHRGAEIILPGSSGNRRTLQCHYHAWTWGLDGKLRAAPRSESESCFNKDLFSLTPVLIEAFGPFIFVNPDPQVSSFSEILGELPEIISKSGTHLSHLKFRERRLYEIKANWKVVVENYLECYHCPIAHKGFAGLIDLDEYQILPYRYFSVQRGPVKDSAKKNRNEKQFDVTDGNSEGLYSFLWPNFMVNTYPGKGNASINIMIPIDENHTLGIFEFLLDEEVSDEEAKKIFNFIDEVQQEDTILCESVQRGLNSGFYQQGRLILSKENGIQHFQQLVYSALSSDKRTLEI